MFSSYVAFTYRGFGSYPPSKTPDPLRAMLKQNELYIFRIGLGHPSGGLEHFEDKMDTYELVINGVIGPPRNGRK